MFKKSMLGFGLSGKIRKYNAYYKSKPHVVYDGKTIRCSVNSWIGGYAYSCGCYCNDAFGPTNGNNLTLFTSKMYATREEAEAELDVAIVSASKEFPETSFYRYRYYPEHEAIGESLCCLNGKWTESESSTIYICSGCRCRYSAYPPGKVCTQCGEFLD